LNPNGIGLGLYICRKVVKLCGGEICIVESVQKVEDPVNHGTKLVFTMPIDEVSPEQIENDNQLLSNPSQSIENQQ